MCKTGTRIYFEDEYCALIYKKAGEDAQRFFVPFFPSQSFVSAVNRLDTPVSGLMLIAFSASLQTALSRSFTANTVKKEYWAICERMVSSTSAYSEMRGGEPVSGQTVRGHRACGQTVATHGTLPPDTERGPHRLEHLIGFRRKTQKAYIAVQPHAKSLRLKKAVLYWTLCGTGERYDFIRIEPETGRTHQIRVQMAAAGHPIKGDLKYGARRSESKGGIRLHAYRLSFTHPVTHTYMSIAALPEPFDRLWAACTDVCLPHSCPPENFGRQAATRLVTSSYSYKTQNLRNTDGSEWLL